MNITKLIEQANYEDNCRDIPKLLQTCFTIIDIDPENLIAITKIIYWCSYTKSYVTILELVEKVHNNKNSMKHIKEVFYRENKTSIRGLLLTAYIDVVKQKEQSGNTYNIGDISNYMTKLYNFTLELDISNLVNAYIEEKQKIIKK